MSTRAILLSVGQGWHLTMTMTTNGIAVVLRWWLLAIAVLDQREQVFWRTAVPYRQHCLIPLSCRLDIELGKAKKGLSLTFFLNLHIEYELTYC